MDKVMKTAGLYVFYLCQKSYILLSLHNTTLYLKYNLYFRYHNVNTKIGHG
jgi:hypothetical protein